MLDAHRKYSLPVVILKGESVTLDLSRVKVSKTDEKEKTVTKTTTKTKKATPKAKKQEKVELKKLGGRPKTQLAAWKRECRVAIREQFPKTEQPLSEHPAEAIAWYENKGYRAPFWLLRKAGLEDRYQD